VWRARADPVPSALPDILAPGLAAVFCGINPGRRSAAAGYHFANPRNDFWRLLHDVGLTPRLLDPAEQHDLLGYGFGVTNAACRTTRGSGDLRRADFASASERLERIAVDLRPRVIAFVGKEAYRGAFGERPTLGLQRRRLGETLLFVLPSTLPRTPPSPTPSGCNGSRSSRRSCALVPPAVRDRGAAVSAEGLRAQLHAGRRLTAFVLRAVDHGDCPLDDLRVEAVRDQILA
jgi:double-stranded uracil-DNA glycosylase